jgi:lambda family phage portal protein
MPLDAPLILDQHGVPLLKERRLRAALGGGWDAGQTGRRLRAIPTVTRAINTLIRAYGHTVLARSRYLSANNAYAAAAREAYVGAMVGVGINPKPLIPDAALKEEVQQVWTDWTDESDADGLTDFYGQQAIIAGEMFEAGEVFVRFRPRLPQDGFAVPLQLQVIPAEMLDTNRNIDLGNGRRIECGIEFDAIGRRTAYHFWSVFPGTDQYFGIPAGLYKVVPADEILHIYRPIRAGQIRGVPHTLSALTTLALLDMYDDAEAERKRIAALFGAFITRPDIPEPEDDPLVTQGPQGNQPQQQPVGNLADVAGSSWDLQPGAMFNLFPGEDIKFAEPADVGNSYEPFQYRALLRVAAGFGVPYSDMTGDLRQTSYGSIRAGIITFRRRIEALQHAVMVYQLCRPVWNRWWTEAVLAQAVPVNAADFAAKQRNYRRVEWVPPHWDWIDPLHDIEAEELAVANHFKSRSEVIKAMGNDPEVVDKEIAQDREREAALGTPPAAPPIRPTLPAPKTAADQPAPANPPASNP